MKLFVNYMVSWIIQQPSFIGTDGKIAVKKIGQMDETFIDETLSSLVSKS